MGRWALRKRTNALSAALQMRKGLRLKIKTTLYLTLVLSLGLTVVIAITSLVLANKLPFDVNDNGQTYGSRIKNDSGDSIFPDLISATGEDGAFGYVLKKICKQIL
jgi:hypothetical protein